MAEELEKYKKILKREDEEFKEVMKAEVTASLPCNSSKQNERYNSGKTHVHKKFFLLINILFHSYYNNIALF